MPVKLHVKKWPNLGVKLTTEVPGCTQGYISKTVTRLQIRCLKGTRVPRYKDDAAKREVKNMLRNV